MSNFDDRLTEALQDTKEAYLIALAMRFISYRIPNAQILMLARTRSAREAIRSLKHSYPVSYFWNRVRRSWRRRSH